MHTSNKNTVYVNVATVFLFSLPVYLLFFPAYSKDTFYCTVPHCAVNSKPMSNRVEKYCIPITVVLNAAFYWEWHVICLNIHNMTHFRQKHQVVYWTISLQYRYSTGYSNTPHFVVPFSARWHHVSCLQRSVSEC